MKLAQLRLARTPGEKQQLVSASLEPGASVSAVARVAALSGHRRLTAR